MRRALHVFSVLALLLGSAMTARSQASAGRTGTVEEPQLLKFRLYELEAGMEAESVTEETTFEKSGEKSEYTRTFLAPTISLAGSGSVYHPSFLRYSLAGEGSYGEGEEDFNSETESTRDEIRSFGNVRGRMDLFSNKPLRGNARGNYGRSYRDYDFFTRSTVESLGYGAQTLYQVPSLYAAATYTHTEEDVLDTSVPSTTEQDVMSTDLRKDRPSGASTLNYTYSENLFEGSSSDSRTRARDHSVSGADNARFGERERFRLNNRASYSHRESENDPNDQYQAGSELTAEHRENLESSYNVEYSRFDDSSLTSDNLAAGAGLHHQLYESLRSSLTGQAGESNFDTDTESDRTRTLGMGLAENYTKNLGANHRLQLDAAVFGEETDGGAPDRAVNERHVFPRPPALEAVVLDLPNVDIASITVTDGTGVRRFARGIDYEVFPRGSRVELRRIPGGNIPEGSLILVSYDAEDTGTDRYRTMTEGYGMRVNLWHNLWGLFARMQRSSNDAAEGLYALEFTRTVFGTDLNFSNVQLSAERERYDSDDSDYDSTRFAQSVWANPDAYSVVGLGLSQSFIDRDEDDEQERSYRATVRYRRTLTRRFWIGVQAGVDRRRGTGVDQDLAVVRPELNYVIGQTRVEAYYDLERNEYLDSEKRDRERIFASVKRRF